MEEPINLIILPGQQTEAPAVPQQFRDMLRKYDPNLIVSWNTARKRFVIEVCVQHFASGAEHTHVCRRNYVCMAQDPEGCMMPLGEKVIEMIAARDTQKAGYGPGDLDRFVRDMRAKRNEQAEELRRKQAETIHEATRDGRRQLLKAAHLIQQHSLEVNQ